MKTGSPWRLKGIRPQARETAREAARRRGISVGEWLNAVIIDSAVGEGIAPARDLPPPLSSSAGVIGKGGLRNIGQPDLEQHSRPNWGSHVERDDHRDDELHEQIAKVMNLVETLARRFEDHQRSHPALMSSKEQPRKERPFERSRSQQQPPTKPWPDSKQPSDPLSSGPANKPTGIEEARSGASDQALHAIRERLDALALQLERYGRLESAPAQPPSLSPLDQAMAQIAERQQALDNEVAPSRTELPRAPKRDIDRNNHPLCNASHVAKTRPEPTAEGLSQLREDLHGLAQASSPDSIAALEQRIAATDEVRPLYHQRAESPQDLGGMIARLDEEVRRLQLERTGLIAARQIQSRIGQLIDKVDASDARLPGLEAIRSNVAELLVRVESQRETEPAGATPDRLKQQSLLNTMESHTEIPPIASTARGGLPEGQAVPPPAKPNTATAPVRASVSAAAPASAKERRQSIASRIEPGAPVRDPGGPAKAAATWATPAPQPKPEISAAEEMSIWRASRGSFSMVGAPAARLSAVPSLAENRPIDPGRGILDMQSASAAERIAASEASLGPARPAGAPESGPKPDFIAAARRAAQAASADSSLGRKGPGHETDPDLAQSAVNRLVKRTRSLLVVAGIAMIVLASLKIGLNLLGGQHGPDDSPAEATQAAPAQDTSVPAPARSSADTTGTTGAAPANSKEPVLPAPAPGSLEQHSELGSGGAPEAAPTADAVPSWLPPLPPISSPARGGRTGSLNSARARPAGTEPSPDAPSTTATVPSPSLATVPSRSVSPSRSLGPSPNPPPSAAPAEGSQPKQAITRPAADETLPIGLGSRLRAAAMNGDAAAQYEVAARFADGRGIRQDLRAAARWFERAADQGLAPAQFRLGAIYERGTGIKKDRESARRLYSAAAQAGNVRAMHNLGVLYAEGIDGKPDYSNAAKWFLKAAGYGLGDSQYNLGVLYARGIGVQTDPAEAYKWFALAARAGDNEAEKKRDDIAAQLDQSSLAAARAAVAAFNPEVEPETATTVKPPPGGWDDPAPPVSKNAFNADTAAARVR